MIYLSEMLRDGNKNRSTSFSDLSFPIIHQIENKIKNKNMMLRRKIKQKLYQKQKSTTKSDDKKQQSNSKKDILTSSKLQKQHLNYLQAYQQQHQPTTSQLTNTYPINLDAIVDEKQESIHLNIYLLMKKRKNIFKVEEVKRKIKIRESNKRINMKQCQCCMRIGKHKCYHTFCEKKCEKYMFKPHLKQYIVDTNQQQPLGKILLQAKEENIQYQMVEALEIAEQVIEQSLKNEVKVIQVIKISPQVNQQIKIPQIDVEYDNEYMDKAIISQNQSKSDIDIDVANSNLSQRKQSKKQKSIQEYYEINIRPSIEINSQSDQQQQNHQIYDLDQSKIVYQEQQQQEIMEEQMILEKDGSLLQNMQGQQKDEQIFYEDEDDELIDRQNKDMEKE